MQSALRSILTPDYDNEVQLQEFIDNMEFQPLNAINPGSLEKYIRLWTCAPRLIPNEKLSDIRKLSEILPEVEYSADDIW